LFEECLERPGEDDDKREEGEDTVFAVGPDEAEEGQVGVEKVFYRGPEAKQQHDCPGDEKRFLQTVLFSREGKNKEGQTDEREIAVAHGGVRAEEGGVGRGREREEKGEIGRECEAEVLISGLEYGSGAVDIGQDPGPGEKDGGGQACDGKNQEKVCFEMGFECGAQRDQDGGKKVQGTDGDCGVTAGGEEIAGESGLQEAFGGEGGLEFQKTLSDDGQEGGTGKEIGMCEVADEEAAAHIQDAQDKGRQPGVAEVQAETVHEDAAQPDVGQDLDSEGMDGVADEAEEPGEGLPEGKARVGG